MTRITPLIMAGGAGTRLWPASRSAAPKQFIQLLGSRSTFQDTILRVSDPDLFGPPIVITNHDYRHMVAASAGARSGVGRADSPCPPQSPSQRPRFRCRPISRAGAAFLKAARRGKGRDAGAFARRPGRARRGTPCPGPVPPGAAARPAPQKGACVKSPQRSASTTDRPETRYRLILAPRRDGHAGACSRFGGLLPRKSHDAAPAAGRYYVLIGPYLWNFAATSLLTAADHRLARGVHPASTRPNEMRGPPRAGGWPAATRDPSGFHTTPTPTPSPAPRLFRSTTP